MSNYQPVPEGKDRVLWEIAHKRASFKSQAIAYAIVNVFFWALWYFTSSEFRRSHWNIYPWPVWITLGWGIGLAFHLQKPMFFQK